MQVYVELKSKWELTHALEVEVDEEIFSEWCKIEDIREDSPMAMDEFIRYNYSVVNVEHPPVPCETITLVFERTEVLVRSDDKRTIYNKILGRNEEAIAQEAKVIKPIEFEPTSDVEWFEVITKQEG